jgi:hypothetical protein
MLEVEHFFSVYRYLESRRTKVLGRKDRVALRSVFELVIAVT